MNIKSRSLVFSPFLGILLVAASPILLAADRVTVGQYEFEITTDGVARQFSQCITLEKAAEINGDSASGRAIAEKAAKGNCKVDSYEATGNKVSYTLTCGDHVRHSETTFHGDHSEGTLSTTAGGKTITQQVTAHRTGACP